MKPAVKYFHTYSFLGKKLTPDVMCTSAASDSPRASHVQKATPPSPYGAAFTPPAVVVHWRVIRLFNLSGFDQFGLSLFDGGASHRLCGFRIFFGREVVTVSERMTFEDGGTILQSIVN